MNIQRVALLFALSLPSLFAQAAGQSVVPVKEVDAFARNSIRGTCLISVSPGESNSGNDGCTLTTTAGVTLGQQVPDKKILVIEGASARCRRSTSDSIAEVIVRSDSQSLRHIPVTTQGSAPGIVFAAGDTSGRFYFRAGEQVAARLGMAAPATNGATCVILLSGYLVDAQ